MNAIESYIEHTNLKPVITDREVDSLVSEAKQYGFYGVCIPPFWVKRAKREIGETTIQLITVAGFPIGYQMTEVKMEEIKLALHSGADEIDVVMNMSAFKIRMDWCKIELAKFAKLIHDQQKIFKVIIETCYLNEEEIIRACKICADAGADFVKTSTGFGTAGATVSNVSLMRSVLPDTVGIKASGGIKSYEQAIVLLEKGADRIGTSSGVIIKQEAAR